MQSMKAAVVEHPIGFDGIHLKAVARPVPGPDETLVRVRATTVISSELATVCNASEATGPRFPMILGNEFAGEVVECPSGLLETGQSVTTAWAGHGWTRDGGHAEYVVSPSKDLIPYRSTLPFTTVAAMPKAFTRAAAARRALQWQPGQTLLIRGGTSGIGLAVASIAATDGVKVISTTRSAHKARLLADLGFGAVELDDGELAARIRARWPDGVDNALEIVGFPAVMETLACVRPGGVVGMIGLLEEQERARREGHRVGADRAVAPSPHFYIPNGVHLTTINHKSLASENDLPGFFGGIQEWIDGVEAGRYKVVIDRIFPFDEIVEAFRYRGSSDGIGKIVVSVD